MPYLTPDSLPTAGDICRPLFIPNDDLIVAAVSGALYDLTLESNWELFGAVTPAAIAARMLEMLESYFTEPCCSESSGMPIGVVFPYVTASPPAGSVACDGTIYLDTTYPDLWAVVDSAWKTDATHWQAPDLRDRVPIGAGSTYDPADTGGASSVTLSIAQLPAHTHPETHYQQSAIRTAYQVGSTAQGNYGLIPGIGSPTGYLNFSAPIITGQTGSGSAVPILPPYVGLKWAVQVA